MSRKPKKSPSFVKILVITDFTRLLRLPPVFLQKYRSILPKNVKLRISSGRTWDVKVEKMEDGPFCFTQGWQNFAEDVGLKFGEFLVFMFDCNSIFDVSIYERSACERENPVINFQIDDSDSDEDHVELIKDSKTKNHNACDVITRRRSEAGKNGGTSKSAQPLEEHNPLYFEILLKLHHRSRISLNKRFCTAARLMGAKTVGLEYLPKQCYQCVILDHRQAYRIDMASGWPEFRVANGLVYGRRYSFEFKPSKNAIQVKEVEKGN